MYYIPPGLPFHGFLCPWDSPGKNPGAGCYALLQGIFLTQELKIEPQSPSLQADSLLSEPLEKAELLTFYPQPFDQILEARPGCVNTFTNSPANTLLIPERQGESEMFGNVPATPAMHEGCPWLPAVCLSLSLFLR